MSNTKEYDAKTRKVIDPERRKALMLLSDEDDSDVLVEVLREKRFRLLGMTGDIDTAFELMRKHKVGIIFLDTDIDGLDLGETLHQIRRKSPDFTVVLLSKTVTREKIEYGFEKGAVAYLVKPFQHEAVIKSMSRFSLS